MNKMKIKYVLPLFMLCTMLAFGQQDRRDQIAELKSSHIEVALKLTAAEAQKFWPLYLNCEQKMEDVRQQKLRPLNNKLDEKGVDALSPKDAQLYLSQIEAAEEEIHNLKKKLMSDLRTVIGPKKVLKLKAAEEDFNRVLLNKYKRRKN